jgi:thimet oligopeptidase
MNRSVYLMSLLATILATSGCRSPEPKNTVKQRPSDRWALEATPLDRTAAELSNDSVEHIAWARAYRTRLLEVSGPRTIENTLVPYNEMMMHLDAALNEANLFARVHPDAEVREVAEHAEQEVQKFITELELDRDLYEAIGSLDVAGADAETQYMVAKRLRDFRRAGVDKSDADRARIAALQGEIVKLGQQFARNVRDDEREIVLQSLSDLQGLPDDWIEKHQPGPDGKIQVTTRYPDFYPFISYARNAPARKALYVEFKNRGYPANLEVLDNLLARRHELANVLGYPDWAEYATEDKMIGSAANAHSFIDRVAQAARPAVEREYDQLLERKRRDIPDAASVEDWEKNYYEQLVKSERYAFDPQAVRPYLNFPDVKQGLFELTGYLFGVTYRQVPGLKLWHDDVTAWDVYQGNNRIGRFYLDLHPRDDKYGHAAQFDYRIGVKNKRLPQAALICNFPNPADSRDGLALMEHEEVVTFFHEFGHLLHAIFSGHRQWMGISGITTEWDFVEAPSQMLEEWCYDAEALRLFAKHHRTREPIPADLVEQLRQARDFGKGLWVAHQTFYAAVSLSYYNRDPAEFDTTDLKIELQEKYSPFEYVPGTHFQCGFGHLDGYSAVYYTYLWSLVISKDLLTPFVKDGLLSRDTADRYRTNILDPGGSKPAAELVRDFLGRDSDFEAFERWLTQVE